MDVWDNNTVAVLRTSQTTIPPWTELMLWCEGDVFTGVYTWWEGSNELDLESVVYLEYTYRLGTEESRSTYFGWLGGQLEWAAVPDEFLGEIRDAPTLWLHLVDAPADEPFEVTFDLTGIEWGISNLPCIE